MSATSMTALEDIKTRTAGLTQLCPDYMARSIRHLERNCDLECPTHSEDDEANCPAPAREDGERIALALADQPMLTAALDAVLATAADLEECGRVLQIKASGSSNGIFADNALAQAKICFEIARDLRGNINAALSPEAAQ